MGSALSMTSARAAAAEWKPQARLVMRSTAAKIFPARVMVGTCRRAFVMASRAVVAGYDPKADRAGGTR